MGPALSIGRFLFTRTLAKEMEPAHRMAETLDIQNTLKLRDFQDMMGLYLRIGEPEFGIHKDTITADAKEKLRKLAEEKVTDELSTGEYYAWLNPMLETAPAGSTIWAISMMLTTEWDESHEEEAFLAQNIAAANRGVIVDRIFVVPRAKIPGLKRHRGVRAHIDDKSGNLHPMIVEREHLESRGGSLLSSLGDGIIAFGNRVVLVDIDRPGGIRGRVSMNANHVASWRRKFDLLRTYARPLNDENLGRWNPPEPRHA
jgi:hypothetical protein